MAVGPEQAHTTRAVAGCVHDAQARPRDIELLTLAQRGIGLVVRVHRVPQHLVGGVQ